MLRVVSNVLLLLATCLCKLPCTYMQTVPGPGEVHVKEEAIEFIAERLSARLLIM